VRRLGGGLGRVRRARREELFERVVHLDEQVALVAGDLDRGAQHGLDERIDQAGRVHRRGRGRVHELLGLRREGEQQPRQQMLSGPMSASTIATS
jgi:hypothetical protein